MTSKIIQLHWDRVLELGCLVTRTPYIPDIEGDCRVTLHHPHGGSMRERGVHRSKGRKVSDLLVVPIIYRIHLGPGGIDGYPRPTVEAWEREHRPQADMVDEVCEAIGADLWALARAEAEGRLMILRVGGDLTYGIEK